MAVKTFIEQPFIGQLDRRIAIYEVINTASATGEKQLTTTLLCNAFAQYKDRSDTLTQDDKVLHVNTRQYIIRYRSDVHSKRLALEIEEDGLRYRVYSVVEMGRNKFLQLTATIHE